MSASAAAASPPAGSAEASGEKPKPAPPLPEPVPLPGADAIKREPNPFTDSDWRMLTYTWAGFTLRFLLIFGAVFSVVQFLAAREEKRVERTLALVELWEKPEYQDAQKALRERIAGLNTRFSSLLGADPSPDELDVYFERVGLEAMKAEGGAMPLAEFQNHFDRIVYFLNRVGSCVEGGLCSAAVSDSYFLDYAASFWRYFSGYAAGERRRGSPRFAKPIETYVARAPEAAEAPPAAAAAPSDPAP